MIPRLIPMLPFICMLAACSTIPVTQETARSVPPERVYESSYTGPATDLSREGTVLFLRDSGFSGSGCTHDIYIDNLKIFAIRQAEKMTIHLPSGPHFIRLETGGGLCPNIAVSQEMDLAAGTQQTYRILLPSDYALRLTRIE